jgi:hypothetical protein
MKSYKFFKSPTQYLLQEILNEFGSEAGKSEIMIKIFYNSVVIWK